VLSFAGGCQIVLGDYEVSEGSPPAVVSTGGDTSTAGTTSLPPGLCTGGERRCEGEVLSRCVDGRFEPETCQSPEHCDEPNARCRTCVEGQTRCRDDKSPQHCDSASDRWVSGAACESGDVCDQALGRCVACQPDIFVCGSETVLCRCKADQTGYEPLRCPTTCSGMGTDDRCVGGEGTAGGPAGVCENI
jgi:hypothetical protein